MSNSSVKASQMLVNLKADAGKYLTNCTRGSDDSCVTKLGNGACCLEVSMGELPSNQTTMDKAFLSTL